MRSNVQLLLFHLEFANHNRIPMMNIVCIFWHVILYLYRQYFIIRFYFIPVVLGTSGKKLFRIKINKKYFATKADLTRYNVGRMWNCADNSLKVHLKSQIRVEKISGRDDSLSGYKIFYLHDLRGHRIVWIPDRVDTVNINRL